MKKILLIVAIMASYTAANAQLFSIGPRAGISSSTIKVDDTDTWEVDKESEFGYHLGLFARLQVPVIGLYVQPEVLFSKTGGRINFDDNDNDLHNAMELEFNRIDVPVLVGWKFGAFRVNAGPTFNFITKAEGTVNGQDFEEVDDKFKNSTVGYQAGIGFDLGKLLLDLKYEGNLSEITDDNTIDLAGEEFQGDYRSSQLILSLGFKL